MKSPQAVQRPTPEERAGDLVEHLLRWQANPANLALLRCGGRDQQRHRAWPLLSLVTELDGNPSILHLYETVAAAFGQHPLHSNHGNLGRTCAQLAAVNPSFALYFERFIQASSRDEVCDRLSSVIMAAKQRQIPINYAELFIDLWYWSEPVIKRWAQQFWADQRSAA
jgi:CRISPR type I-E-associated protein CasB/Cse2